jgi:hypothetical protein
MLLYMALKMHIGVWACLKYRIAPVWCQRIAMRCWDVWEEAFSVPGHIGVVVRIVGFVTEGSGICYWLSRGELRSE